MTPLARPTNTPPGGRVEADSPAGEGALYAYANLSTLYRDWNKLDQAARALDQARQLLPKITDPANNLWYRDLLDMDQGMLEFGQEHWENAIRLLKQADTPEQQFEEVILYYLALSYENTGATPEACRAWQRYDQTAHSGMLDEDRRQAVAQQRRKTLQCAP